MTGERRGGRIVMAIIVPADGQLEDAEAEPVVVDIEGSQVILTLDDGTKVVLARAELLTAASPANTGWGRNAA